MLIRSRLALTVAATAVCAFGLQAGAETPPDTLVIADKIDDIVSLDPAEAFEFSGMDVLNNTYDTLIELDPADLLCPRNYGASPRCERSFYFTII